MAAFEETPKFQEYTDKIKEAVAPHCDYRPLVRMIAHYAFQIDDFALAPELAPSAGDLPNFEEFVQLYEGKPLDAPGKYSYYYSAISRPPGDVDSPEHRVTAWFSCGMVGPRLGSRDGEMLPLFPQFFGMPESFVHKEAADWYCETLQQCFANVVLEGDSRLYSVHKWYEDADGSSSMPWFGWSKICEKLDEMHQMGAYEHGTAMFFPGVVLENEDGDASNGCI